MTKMMNAMLAVLGIWLVVSPFLIGYAPLALWITLAGGAAIALLAIAAAKPKEYKPGLDYVISALGAALVVWGIVDVAVGFGGAYVNEIIVGVLVFAIAFVATRFATSYSGASFYDRGGAPMVDVKSLRLKDDTILMKALLLQSMPSTVYVRPDEVWKVLTMVPFDLIKGLPKFLIQGYKACKQQEREAAKASK